MSNVLTTTDFATTRRPSQGAKCPVISALTTAFIRWSQTQRRASQSTARLLDSSYNGENYTMQTHIKTLLVSGTVDTQIVVDSQNATVRGIDDDSFATVNNVVVYSQTPTWKT